MQIILHDFPICKLSEVLKYSNLSSDDSDFLAQSFVFTEKFISKKDKFLLFFLENAINST